MGIRGRALALVVAAGVAGCGGTDDDPGSPAAGDATVTDRTATAFTHTVTGLSADQMGDVLTGAGQFSFQWDLPQLGPLFNNNACVNCHTGNGRGLDEVALDVLTGSQGLVRVSLGSGTPDQPGGPVPVPDFGLQLQDHAELGAQEVNLALSFTEQPGAFADGTTYSLRTPVMAIATPDGNPFRADALRSFRQPPGVFGLGLIAAVPDDAILANEDPDDADGDGISGRANHVWDVTSASTIVGRFGHKANQSSLRQQAMSAFANDIGVTNTLFPDPSGATEIGDDSIDAVVTFLSTLAVPDVAPTPETGRALFTSFHCAACHLPTLVTGPADVPQLANQTIHPYTDLLLHDLGPDLADDRPDFLATGSEWRTAPLWGLGLVQVVNPTATFLHDGRARTPTEAILWHGGEALPAREAFRTASASDRAALLTFLSSL